jgi:hypothetical protein
MTDNGDDDRQDHTDQQYSMQVAEELIHFPTPET